MSLFSRLWNPYVLFSVTLVRIELKLDENSKDVFIGFQENGIPSVNLKDKARKYQVYHSATS